MGISRNLSLFINTLYKWGVFVANRPSIVPEALPKLTTIWLVITPSSPKVTPLYSVLFPFNSRRNRGWELGTTLGFYGFSS